MLHKRVGSGWKNKYHCSHVSGGFSCAYVFRNATQAFNVLLLSGAGSGAIFLLRWFWWRINALTEIVAMIVATFAAVILVLFIDDADVKTVYLDGFTVKLLIAVGITTVSWVSTTLLTRPESYETLKRFYLIARTGGPGWRKLFHMAMERDDKELLDADQTWDVPQGLLSVLLGCLGIYSALFGIGNIIYGNVPLGLFLFLIMAICTFLIMRISRKFKY
jgi:SSS family solute:Na+ symporter